MTQVEVLGRTEALDRVLQTLQSAQIAEAVPLPGSSPAATEPATAHALDILEALLAYAPDQPGRPPGEPVDEASTLAVAERLLPAMGDLDAQEQALAAEDDALAAQIAVLDALSALVPELAELSEAELDVLRLATVALVLDDPDGRVVEVLAEQLNTLLGDRHLLVTTRPGDPLPDEREGVLGCLLVLPRSLLPVVESLLSADRIARVAVPAAYAGHSLAATVALMRERQAGLAPQQAAVAARRQALLELHLRALAALRAMLRARAERERAAASAVRTERTFSVRLWVPRERLDEFRALLAPLSVVVATVRRGSVWGEAPVLLRTRPAWGPYQRLVGFLSWPSPRGPDPSGLMALALPFLFGVMVGDVVYGVLLAGLGWWLRRRWPQRPVVVDAGRILLAGGIWATIFGVLFGEALGSLGNQLGMPALWFYRGGPAALQPLLLFALAIGATHIVLGLLLGVWTAARQGQYHRLTERAGTLLVLVGLFALLGVLAEALPAGLLTPAVAGVIVGVVAASVSHGALGLLLGPLELLGALGNILSYLRVAAVGLASVYLANVANELAANAPLVLGILVATCLHALNLALAAFSPTVQALRLHYVEFFSKFYDGGGRPFTPLGSDLHVPPPATPATHAGPPPRPTTSDRAQVGAALP